MPAPALPEVRMNVVRPAAPVIGRVVRNEICTASRKAAGFVRHIEFDVSGTPLAGAFRAGQAFGVLPPGVDPKTGKPHAVRLYSLACPTGGEDGAGAVISTTVKRTIDEHWDDQSLFLGVASNYLCDLREGDEVRLSGPNGKRFLLPENHADHEYLFLATGTGIAPFRGMVRELLGRGCDRPITLIMGSPYRTDLLYHEEFRSLEADHANFTYLTAISRERDDNGGPGLYAHERLAMTLERAAPGLAEGKTLVYICGIAGMEAGVARVLTEALPAEALAPYLTITDDALRADPDAWTREGVRRGVRFGERVFIEVY